MSSASVSPIGRLAPSPTGLLHLGHARTFLVAWCCARSASGKLLLRFEDLDRERSRPEFVERALLDLAWLGIDWDGPVSHQSEHFERIGVAAGCLENEGYAYACVCSRADIRAALGAPHAGEIAESYPGSCRGLFASRVHALQQTAAAAGLRFRAPSEAVVFEDAIQGQVVLTPAAAEGDFLIVRRDGIPAYQLAVVVDDEAQGINQVVRGADLLDSTPRQLALINALGYRVPTYVHVPLVLDAVGTRLAKRSDGLSLHELREAGVSAARVLGWVANSLGLADNAAVSASDLLARFDIKRIKREPVRVDRSEFGL